MNIIEFSKWALGESLNVHNLYVEIGSDDMGHYSNNIFLILISAHLTDIQ